MEVAQCAAVCLLAIADLCKHAAETPHATDTAAAYQLHEAWPGRPLGTPSY